MQFWALQIFILQMKCNYFLPVSKDLKQTLCNILEMLPDCLHLWRIYLSFGMKILQHNMVFSSYINHIEIGHSPLFLKFSIKTRKPCLLKANYLVLPICELILVNALPSFTIPTLRHFWNRQYWHLFRRRLSTRQFLLARQTYFAFFWTVL